MSNLDLNLDYVRQANEERIEWIASEACRLQTLAFEADELHGRLLERKWAEEEKLGSWNDVAIKDCSEFWRVVKIVNKAWARRERRFNRMYG